MDWPWLLTGTGRLTEIKSLALTDEIYFAFIDPFFPGMLPDDEFLRQL